MQLQRSIKSRAFCTCTRCTNNTYPTAHLLLQAQIIGAMFGSCIVYLLYHDAIDAYDGGHRTMNGQSENQEGTPSYRESARGHGWVASRPHWKGGQRTVQ